MKRSSLIVAIPIVILLAAGCAKPPTDKLASAEQAVNDARTSGAATYMGEDFAKVQSTLAMAKQEMAEQSNKFVLLRDYEKSDHLLSTVQADAARIAEQSTQKKNDAKAAAAQAQQAAKEAVKRAQDLFAMAPVGNDRVALRAIKADVDGLAASVGEVQSAMDTGDYPAAQVQARAIRDKSGHVSAAIEHALAKVHKTTTLATRRLP